LFLLDLNKPYLKKKKQPKLLAADYYVIVDDIE
jgi:hypothetical protein